MNWVSPLQKLYDFIWDEFCDWYIEIAKIRLQSGEGADTAKAVLVYVLTGCSEAAAPLYALYHRGNLSGYSARYGVHYDLQVAGI